MDFKEYATTKGDASRKGLVYTFQGVKNRYYDLILARKWQRELKQKGREKSEGGVQDEGGFI